MWGVAPPVYRRETDKMFDEIMGLPAHPLAVHAPIVLVALLVLLAVAYVLVPPIRSAFIWPFLLLCVIAPITVFVARETGLRFEQRLMDRAPLPEELANQINEHQNYGSALLWFVIGLALASLLFLALDWGRRRARLNSTPDSAGEPAPVARGRMIMMLLSGALMLVLAGFSAWYLFKTGGSGAYMVWSNS